MSNLYEQFKKAGCKIENHYSDMYVEVTSESTKIIELLKNTNHHATTFRHQIHNTIWYEFPLIYTPYWEKCWEKCKQQENNT